MFRTLRNVPPSIFVPFAAWVTLTCWALLGFVFGDGPAAGVLFGIAACFYLQELGHYWLRRTNVEYSNAVTSPPATGTRFVTLAVFVLHAALLIGLAYRVVNAPAAGRDALVFALAIGGPLSIKRFGETLKGPKLRLAVAAVSICPPAVLTRLAANPDRAVRSFVAYNRNTPPEALAVLAADPDVTVREHVAGNMNTPAATLSGLAADPDLGVRLVAEVGLPGTPPDRVAELAADADSRVRARAAMRPGLPAGVLAELAVDSHPLVRKAARANPGFAAPGVAAHAGLLAD